MITHFKYWNKWRKKFPTAYGKWTKLLTLLGLKKPSTLRLMIFADRFNAATVAFNALTEVLNQKAPEKKDENKQQDRGYRAKAHIYDEAMNVEDGDSNEVPKV